MWRSAVLPDHPLGFFLLLLVPGPLGYSVIEKCSIRYYTFQDKGFNQAIRSKCDCYDIITVTYFLNVDGTPRRKVKVG